AVVILEFGNRNPFGLFRGRVTFAAIPAIRFRWRLTGQSLDRVREVDAIEKFNKRDDIALMSAAATVKQLLARTDAEAIVTAALRTGSARRGLALELDATISKHALNRHSASAINPRIPFCASHDTILVLSPAAVSRSSTIPPRPLVVIPTRIAPLLQVQVRDPF